MMPESFGRNSVIGIYSSKSTLAKLNFTILRRILENSDDKIMFFSVEKPHHYMTHLLGINGVSQRNVTYVDILSPGAAEISFPVRVGEGHGIMVSGFITRDMVLLEEYRYLIVDNIEFLTHMWSEETLRRFVSNLVKEGKKANITVIFPVKKPEKIKKIIGKSIDNIVEFDEVMK
ncbi:MAG: hypothetical protein GXO25_03130 [Euryarchaeota archaeon]|nr:hypothetical protein [Euryarchaeota archaeon]